MEEKEKWIEFPTEGKFEISSEPATTTLNHNNTKLVQALGHTPLDQFDLLVHISHWTHFNDLYILLLLHTLFITHLLSTLWLLLYNMTASSCQKRLNSIQMNITWELGRSYRNNIVKQRFTRHYFTSCKDQITFFWNLKIQQLKWQVLIFLLCILELRKAIISQYLHHIYNK